MRIVDNTISASIVDVTHSFYEAVDFKDASASVSVTQFENMEVITQDEDVAKLGADSHALTLPAGMALTQAAVPTGTVNHHVLLPPQRHMSL